MTEKYMPLVSKSTFLIKTTNLLNTFNKHKPRLRVFQRTFKRRQQNSMKFHVHK